jgi:hypothetical protein
MKPLDRYAACCVNFVLLVARTAVLGARSAPGDTGNQARALPGYQGQSPWLVPTLAAVLLACWPANALAFCGFYVTKADTKLFNRASKVVIVRDGDRTVLTMSNDFKGDPKEFAVVIPVPTVLQREQIHVGEQKVIDHLDAFTAPRLVEYFDPDPCAPHLETAMAAPRAGMVADRALLAARSQEKLGVTIEATYTVGEYDILILSAKESGGLETWLRANGYRLPAGASAVLASYIKQNMRFFVAKVNLAEKTKLGFTYLRPLQMAFESPKFMLPIRLGTVNADGAQELFVFALTRKGRVETTNYRTTRLPSDVSVPVFVKDEFGPFYRAMFSEQVRRHQMSTVFLEYAWDMGWCDPCATDPLTDDELRQLGVFWLWSSPSLPTPRRFPSRPNDVFVTRLHVRYDAAHFPEDLVFQETGDRTNFQGRYVLNHPWSGKRSCAAAEDYLASLPRRLEKEAQTLASLTGWAVADIRKKMPWPEARPEPSDREWWRIWR